MSETQTKPVRAAVVGIGGRGSWLAETVNRHEAFDLVALCDRNERHLEYFRKTKQLTHVPAYTSLETCLAVANTEAVLITTPDGNHADVAVPALEAGNHVFLEKPLDVTESRCRAIVEADRLAGGKTFVGFNLRFAPVYVRIRALIDEGAIGDVLTIQEDEFYDGGRTYFRRWNRFRKDGGGLWITKACHDFDLMYWMAGVRPLSVYATDALSYYRPRADAAEHCENCHVRDSCPDSYHVIAACAGAPVTKPVPELAEERGMPRPDICLYNSKKDTFDHGVATVRFENDVIGTYTCNVVTGFSDRRMRVSGTRGTLDGALSASHVTLRRRDPSAVEEIPVGGAEGGHGGGDNFLLTDFYEFTQGRKEPKVRPTEATIPVLMGLAATRSSDEHRVVPMSEFMA